MGMYRSFMLNLQRLAYLGTLGGGDSSKCSCVLLRLVQLTLVRIVIEESVFALKSPLWDGILLYFIKEVISLVEILSELILQRGLINSFTLFHRLFGEVFFDRSFGHPGGFSIYSLLSFYRKGLV